MKKEHQNKSAIAVIQREVDGARGNDSRDRVLVDHLGDRVLEQHYILVERFDLPLQLDAIDKVNRYRDVFLTQCVQKRVL